MAKPPPPPIYTRQINLAHAVIQKYGISAILRRSTGDRPCIVFLSHLPRERQGNLINQTDRRALLSPIGLTEDPDSELDKLVTIDPETGLESETLRIIAPIGKLAPADIVIYWELQIRK
jgi:hypothetical protein